jgi:hypothetical protein
MAVRSVQQVSTTAWSWTAVRALNLPEHQQSTWIDREIAFLKRTGMFPPGYPDKLEGYVRERLAQVSSSGGGVSMIGSG